MESFAVNHAGAITVKHVLDLSPSVVHVSKELTKAASIIVAGWVAVTVIKELRRATSSTSS
ncbi:hypothetical protein H2203_004449 [Taxawa tesnikishii (nom. ined.)]|nr:hypothetical protein H2203_004449 [Dothideales sp. JES 119]